MSTQDKVNTVGQSERPKQELADSSRSRGEEILSHVQDETTKENEEYITGVKLLAVVAAVTLTAFLIMLDNSILSTALPQITSHFHSLPDVGWYLGAYPLANAAFQPLAGKIYTYFQIKYAFLVFLFLFELGSIVCGSAISSPMLIGGRVLAGVGGAGLINGAVTIIAGCTPLDRRPFYTGIMLGIASLGIVSGPLIGGALTQYASWRWCFYINLPIGGLSAAILLSQQVPEITKKEKFSSSLVRKVIPELDLFGFALFAPAAIMFLMALQFGSERTYTWNSSMIIGLFCGAGVTAILFMLWERHMGDRATIPKSMVRQRIVICAACFHLCTMSSMIVAANYLPIYFQTIKGAGPSISGVYVLPNILSQLLFAILSGGGVSKLGYYLPWAVFSAAFRMVGSGLISTFTQNTTTGVWIGYQIILGAAHGSGMQMESSMLPSFLRPTNSNQVQAMIAVQNVVAPALVPLSQSFIVFVQNIGVSVFTVVATTIFSQTLVSELAKHAPSVDPQAALNAGGNAAAVRALVPPGSPELDDVLRAYSASFRNVFYLMIGIAAAGLMFACGMGWKDVRKNKAGKKDEESGNKDEVKEAEKENELKRDGEEKEEKLQAKKDDVSLDLTANKG